MIDTALPLAERLPAEVTPEDVFRRLAVRPHCIFFDSALRHPWLGRYSFVAADPFEFLSVPADGGDGLALLDSHVRAWRAEQRPDLPPFQGGAAGFLSYDLNRSLESLPRPAFDEFRCPALAFGLYDLVVAFDHEQRETWVLSTGFPERTTAARRARAARRIDLLREWLAGPTPQAIGAAASPSEDSPTSLPRATSCNPVSAESLAPQWAIDWHGAKLKSTFDRHRYLNAVARVIEYIHAGDCFQVNLAQRLLCPAECNPVALYLRLRACNPAPFAGYFDAGTHQLASASPERFLRIAGRAVETRPIKGTRRRSGNERIDAATAAELIASVKDRSENVMIVDLLRNDLARVCTPASVRVSQLCEIEYYAQVMHLVSAVEGELAEGRTLMHLLRAAFPGGSVTGAPKIRAMEIIAELEPTARGAYCGSLGYISFGGHADFNILIRTITAAGGWWQFPVGGGIVASSQPEREYEETWEKAAGLLQAVAGEGSAARAARNPKNGGRTL